MYRATSLAKAAVLCLCASAATCVRNPVTGTPQLSLVSQSDEIAMGKQAAEEALQSIGPYSDPALETYVSGLGRTIAKSTERANLPWNFHILDDPAVNAFALPGGEIFLTRGILGYLTSEAELVAVLGHECGHVAAKHSVTMLSKQQIAELGLGIGSILVPDIQTFGAPIGAGLQILFLKYSRDNEVQADELGFGYGFRLGYDVRTMKDLFTMLDGVSKTEGGRLPEWLATHPNPGNRLERTEQRLAALGDVDWDKLVVRRDAYLRHIDGLVFGEDPRQGYVRNSTFIHPELGFRMEFPRGWKIQNQRTRVISVSGDRDAAIELGLVSSRSPDQAMKEFFSSSDLREMAAPSGAPAGNVRYFQAGTEGGSVGGLVSFFAFGNRTFQYVAYSDIRGLAAYDPTFRSSLATFGKETDKSLLNVQVARIQLEPVPGDMTLEEFQRRFPSTIPLEELALINGTVPNRPLTPGQLIKRVVPTTGKSAAR